MTRLDDTARRNRAVLDSMRSTRELSAPAYAMLRRAMLAGDDTRPYYSLDGVPYVWSEGKRYTASMYNALAYREELTPPGGEGFYPVVLWRLNMPGFHYTDADGSPWATFSSGERVTCSICGAGITHGYITHDVVAALNALDAPARHVCVAHVAAHNGEYGAPEDGASNENSGEGISEGSENGR